MKKISALLLAFVLTFFFVISFFPVTAYAVEAVISSGGSYDLASYGNDSIITISTTEPVTLTQTNPETALHDFRIVCSVAGVDLTIDGINIVNISDSYYRALAFTGTGNTLTLAGSSTLVSGENMAGIRVNAGTALSIKGSGSVNVTGGYYAAGIGGEDMKSGGTIEISGGVHITAKGGPLAAAIGGGNNGNGGTITISGGTVTANGNASGTGIGGGYNGSGGTITISGGSVTASSSSGYVFTAEKGAAIGGGGRASGGTIKITGGIVTATARSSGAAIGGGEMGQGGNITIEGDAEVTAYSHGYGAGIGGGNERSGGDTTIQGDARVTVYSYSYGAGIGGGINGGGGTIRILGNAQVQAAGSSYGGAGIGGGHSGGGADLTIQGATVFAAGDTGMDIGSGSDSTSEGTFDISGSSVVFLKNDSCTQPTAVFGYFPMRSADGGGKIFGFELPAGWTEASGFHYGIITVHYNPNGGGGGVPVQSSEPFDVSYNFTVRTSDGLTYYKHYLKKWNTQPDESGEDYIPGEEYTANTSFMLYAIWGEYPVVTYNANGAYGTAPADDMLTDLASSSFTASGEGSLYLSNHHFIKWNTQPDGKGTDCLPGMLYSVNGDITLYAQWNKYISSISLDKSSLSMVQGQSAQLMASASPADAQSTIYWTSSENSVATVDQNGKVTGRGEGTAAITASADGKSATCTVSVSQNTVSGISLDYSSRTMYKGGIIALTATVSPDDVDLSVTWRSSDSSVATVTQNGVVTAVGTGSCTITASAGSESDTCRITVEYEPKPRVDVSSVNISVNSAFTAVLYVGDTMMLSANVSPSDATDQSVTWQSSDSSIASVTSLGKVTAVSEGSVTITAAAQNKTAAYSITVKSSEEPVGTPVPSPSPSPTPDTEDTAEAVITVKLDMTQLPEGTKYIKLSNGEIIELNGEKEISVIVPQESLSADGTIEIVALDEGQVPLGSVNAEPEYIKDEDDMQEASAPVWKMIVMLLAGLAVGAAGAVIAIRLIVARKRA